MKAACLRAPFPYPGGKSRVARYVWARLGECSYYVEPCLGSGAMWLACPYEPAAVTLNDMDCYLVNFWRAVRSQRDEVARWADWPISEPDLVARHRWLRARALELRRRILEDPEFCDPKAAGWWVWGACQWIGSGWCRIDGRGEGREISAESGRGAKRPMIDRGRRGVLRAVESQIDIEGKGVLSADIRKGRGPLSKQALKIAIAHPGKGITSPRIRRAAAAALSLAPGEVLRSNDSAKGVNSTWCRGALVSWMCELSNHFRVARVLAGDFERTLSAGSTFKRWPSTAVFLDPPYAPARRRAHLYNEDSPDVAERARAWCSANGKSPRLRIALCGLSGEHSSLEQMGWSRFDWRRPLGGNGSETLDEAIWFSPACLPPPLFDPWKLEQLSLGLDHNPPPSDLVREGGMPNADWRST